MRKPQLLTAAKGTITLQEKSRFFPVSHETRVKTHWKEAVPEIKSPMFRISRSPAGSEFPATGDTAEVGPKDYKGQTAGKNSRFLANGTMKNN